jgi:integrase
VKSIRLSFSQLIQSVGNVDLKSISTRELDKFLTSVFSRSKHAAWLYYRTLKAALSKAVEWNYIDSNPLKMLRLPKIPRPHPRFLSTEDLNLILKNTDSDLMRNLFLTAFYTGLREGEIVNMKWSWIDFEEKLITVKISNDYITKNKQERIIPLTTRISKMIISRYNDEQDPIKNPYVFYRIKGIKLNEDFVSRYFKKVVRLVGLPDDIHFHTLRHSFASNLVQRGISIYSVKELLGHKSIVTTMIYSHLNRESLIKAISCLE